MPMNVGVFDQIQDARIFLEITFLIGTNAVITPQVVWEHRAMLS